MEWYTAFRVLCIGGLVFAALAAFAVYACLVIGARADRLSERVVNQLIEQRKSEQRVQERIQQFVEEDK